MAKFVDCGSCESPWCAVHKECVNQTSPKGPSPMPTDLTPLERELCEALREARKIIADIDDYMKRPERGDWGAECACCMGELLDDDRETIALIDQALSTYRKTPNDD